MQKKEKASQVSCHVTLTPQTSLHLLKSDGPNNYYGSIKPPEIYIYHRLPHSAKLSDNVPSLLQGLGNTMDSAGLKLGLGLQIVPERFG